MLTFAKVAAVLAMTAGLLALTGQSASAAMSEAQARAYCAKKYGHVRATARQEAIDKCVRFSVRR